MYDQQDDADEKQDPADLGCYGRNSRQTQKRGDQTNDQKSQRIA
jgi:hypothetical protein